MSKKNVGGAELFAVGVLGVIFIAVGFIVQSWLVMLTVGALHSHYAYIPPVGFDVAMLLVLLFSFLNPRSYGVDKD